MTDYDARACRRFYRVTLLALSGRTNRSISKRLERAGPLNGKNSKNVVARDERGRWLKGFSGGPGRPFGSRNKLSEDFLRDLQEDWEQHGKKIIKIMREKFPEIYFQSMVKLALVHRVELGQPKEFDKPRTVEEALAQLEERVGTKGRRLFEDFLREAERLEAEENWKQSMLNIPPTRPSCAQLDVNVYNAVTCTP